MSEHTLDEIKGLGPATKTKLHGLNIHTVEALAFTTSRDLEEAGIKDAAPKLIQQAIEFLAERSFISASELLEQRKSVTKLSTGSKQLDELFQGGYETQSITEYASPYGCGKTQLCLTAAAIAQQPKEQGGLDGGVLWIDSVSGPSPVIVKDEQGLIDVRPIEDVAPFSNFKEIERVKPINNFKVWDGTDFKRINYAYRHKVKTLMHRVNAHCGVIDVTPAHSLFYEDGAPMRADMAKVGDEILLGRPLPLTQRFEVPEDLSWLYGFFVAEGTIRYPQSGRKSKGYDISIANKDEAKLRRCEKAIEKYFGNPCYITEDKHALKLGVRESTPLARLWLRMFYTYKRMKRIPRLMLNAKASSVQAFMRGFQSGGGHRDLRRKFDLNNLSTSSVTVACGLSLFANLLGQRPTLFTRADKPKAIEIQLNKPFSKHVPTVKSNYVKKIFTWTHEGNVYDLNTESQRFVAGVNVVAHNSEETFRPERVYQIAEARGFDPEKVVKGIMLAPAYNSEHQTLIAQRADEVMKQNKIRLIVVDSVLAHFRSEYLGRDQLPPRQGKLNQHLHQIMKLARAFNAVAIVTNQATANPTGNPFAPEWKATGGHIMAHTTNLRVFLRPGGKNVRIASIADSSWLEPGERLFKITAKGIEDVPEEEKKKSE